MDPEIHNFITIWLTAILSLVYTHQIAARIPGGPTRLLSLLPVFYLLTTLPLLLSSFHLAAPTVFYLVWLANFKLLLFSFHQGPLSPSNPPLSLLHFISIALLPIKPAISSTPSSNHHHRTTFLKRTLFLFLLKCCLLAAIVWSYNFRESMQPYILLALYCCHVYLGIELVLALTAVPVRAVLGLDLEPQFNEPYLSTSLQDFWGRRWNLMVTSILRPTVYQPIRRVALGRQWARPAAIMATFVVSGLMHELIYFYLSRAEPTWEVTWFFVLHGLVVTVEVVVKKALIRRGWRLHRLISGPMAVGFVMVTGYWLFFPQVIRNGIDLKAIDEYYILVRFVREKIGVFLGY